MAKVNMKGKTHLFIFAVQCESFIIQERFLLKTPVWETNKLNMFSVLHKS